MARRFSKITVDLQTSEITPPPLNKMVASEGGLHGISEVHPLPKSYPSQNLPPKFGDLPNP